MELEKLPEGWESWEIEPIEPGSRRTLDERMVARGKFARAMVADRVLELEAGSGIRRRLVTSGIRGGFALVNRMELDQVLNGYAEDCEYIYDDGVPLGMKGKAHGREEVRALIEQFDEAFEQRFYYPRLVIDPGGPRFGGRVDSTAVAHASRIEIRLTLWHAVEMANGLIARQLTSSDRDQVMSRLAQ